MAGQIRSKTILPHVLRFVAVWKIWKNMALSSSVILIWSKVLIVYCVYGVCKMGEMGIVCTKW